MKRLAIEQPPRLSIIVLDDGSASSDRLDLATLIEPAYRARQEVLVVRPTAALTVATAAPPPPFVAHLLYHDNLAHGANEAAKLARGDWLLLLVAGDRPAHGCLDALLATAGEDQSVGVVAPKLVRPDGTIVEAGAIVWADGAITSHGWGQPGADPAADFARATDAATGCALVRRAHWRRLGGLDSAYRSLRGALVDACLALWQAGATVRYQPGAVIVVAGTRAGLAGLPAADQQRLQERRSSLLDGRPAPAHVAQPKQAALRGRDKNILLLADRVPDATTVAGRHHLNVLDHLRAADHHVTLVSEQPAADAFAVSALTLRGVETHAGAEPATVLPTLCQALRYDVVWCASAAVAARQVALARRLAPSATFVVDGAGDDDTLARLRALAPLLDRVVVPDEDTWLAAEEALLGKEIEVADAAAPAATVHACYANGDAPARRSTPLVSLILQATRELYYTRLCLESLVRFTRPPYELVVVAPGASERARDYFASAPGPGVTLLTGDEADDGPATWREGVAAARGDHVLLLTDDVVVTEGWLDGLLAPLERDPRVAIVGPLADRASGAQLVRTSYGDDLEAMERFAHAWRKQHFGAGEPVRQLDQFCLLVRRSLLHALAAAAPEHEPDLCAYAHNTDKVVWLARDAFVHRARAA